MEIIRLICYIKGCNQVFNHTVNWYDFSKKPWIPLECNIGKYTRCGEMRSMNFDNQ